MDQVQYLQCIHDFKSRYDDELTLLKGDQIQVIETDKAFGDGWYIGRNLTTRQAGLFPKVFTKELGFLSSKSQPAGSPFVDPPHAVATAEQAPAPVAAATGASAATTTAATGATTAAQLPQSQLQSQLPAAPLPPAQLPAAQLPQSQLPSQLPQTQLPSQLPQTQKPSASQPFSAEVNDTIVDIDAAINEINSSYSTPDLANIPNWTPEEVMQYFEVRGYEKKVAQQFVNHNITGSILLELDLAYLKEIDITSFGTRFELSKDIKYLNSVLRGGKSPMPASAKRHSLVASNVLSQFANESAPAKDAQTAPAVDQHRPGPASPEKPVFKSTALGSPMPPPPAPKKSAMKQHRRHSSKPSFDNNYTYPMKSDPAQSPVSAATKANHRKSLSFGQLSLKSKSSSVVDLASNHHRDPSTGSVASGGRSPYGHQKHTKSSSSIAFGDLGFLRRLSQIGVEPSHMHTASNSSYNDGVHQLDEYDGSSDFSAASPIKQQTSRVSQADRLQDKRIGTDPTTQNSGLPAGAPSPKRTESAPLGKFKTLRQVSSQATMAARKKKQATTAFTEGLQPVSAQESEKTADFYGWMQKRGGLGMFKARYFTLHGTRLSYFASHDDAREKGLIDITAHRVLPANQDNEDKLVSVYAASVGAGRHCFKLVPPAPGSKKSVTFTAQKVHYFCVDTKEQMRAWMAALMKATIDRDDSQPVVSSCATPTFSLQKAQELFAEARAREEDLRQKMVAGGIAQYRAYPLNGSGSGAGSLNYAEASRQEDMGKKVVLGGHYQYPADGASTPDSPSALSLRSEKTDSSATNSSSLRAMTNGAVNGNDYDFKHLASNTAGLKLTASSNGAVELQHI